MITKYLKAGLFGASVVGILYLVLSYIFPQPQYVMIECVGCPPPPWYNALLPYVKLFALVLLFLISGFVMRYFKIDPEKYWKIGACLMLLSIFVSVMLPGIYSLFGYLSHPNAKYSFRDPSSVVYFIKTYYVNIIIGIISPTYLIFSILVLTGQTLLSAAGYAIGDKILKKA